MGAMAARARGLRGLSGAEVPFPGFHPEHDISDFQAFIFTVATPATHHPLATIQPIYQHKHPALPAHAIVVTSVNADTLSPFIDALRSNEAGRFDRFAKIHNPTMWTESACITTAHIGTSEGFQPISAPLPARTQSLPNRDLPESAIIARLEPTRKARDLHFYILTLTQSQLNTPIAWIQRHPYI